MKAKFYVPLVVEHVVRLARVGEDKMGDIRAYSAQNYVIVRRDAQKRQLVCIGKDEWAKLRAEIDAVFGVTP